MCIRDRLQLPRTMRRAAFHISSPMSRAFLLLQDVLRGLCVDIVIPLPEATADHFFERGIAFQELFYFVHRDFCSSLDREPVDPVSYTHLRAHETRHDLVCRLLLEKKKK